MHDARWLDRTHGSRWLHWPRPPRRRPSARTAASSASCAKASLTLVHPGTLTIGTDNPAYPPWYAGGTPKGSPWKLNDPATGKGFEPAVAYAVAAKLGFTQSEVNWVYVPFNRSFAPGKKKFDFDINQISYTPARAKVVTFSSSYYDVDQALVVLKGTPIAKVHSIAGPDVASSSARSSGRRATATSSGTIKPTKQPVRVHTERGRRPGAEEQADRRARGRPADGLLHHLGRRCRTRRSSVSSRPRRAVSTSAWSSRRATRSPSCVDGALKTLKSTGTLAKIQQHVAGEGDRRAGPEVAGTQLEAPRRLGLRRRRPPRRRDRARQHGRLLRGRRLRDHALAGLARGRARRSSTGASSRARCREIARAFQLNVKIFCIAEVFILVFALAARGDPEPAGAGVLSAARARDRLRRLLPRRADDPRDRDARLRRAGAPAEARADLDDASGGSSRSSSSTRRTSPRSTAPGSSRCIRPRRRRRARSV